MSTQPPIRPPSDTELLSTLFDLGREVMSVLEHDSVVEPGAPGLDDLGITPTAVELVLPTYLEAYRRGGRYAGTRQVLAGPSESRAAGQAHRRTSPRTLPPLRSA